MATLTAEREAVVTDAAKSETKDVVTGSAATGEARAWNSRAQVD